MPQDFESEKKEPKHSFQNFFTTPGVPTPKDYMATGEIRLQQEPMAEDDSASDAPTIAQKPSFMARLFGGLTKREEKPAVSSETEPEVHSSAEETKLSSLIAELEEQPVAKPTVQLEQAVPEQAQQNTPNAQGKTHYVSKETFVQAVMTPAPPLEPEKEEQIEPMMQRVSEDIPLPEEDIATQAVSLLKDAPKSGITAADEARISQLIAEIIAEKTSEGKRAEQMAKMLENVKQTIAREKKEAELAERAEREKAAELAAHEAQQKEIEQAERAKQQEMVDEATSETDAMPHSFVVRSAEIEGLSWEPTLAEQASEQPIQQDQVQDEEQVLAPVVAPADMAEPQAHVEKSLGATDATQETVMWVSLSPETSKEPAQTPQTSQEPAQTQPVAQQVQAASELPQTPSQTPLQAQAPFEEPEPLILSPVEPEEADMPDDPESVQYGLQGMRMKLLLRTVLTGIFGVSLFFLGLMGQGMVPAIDAIDPATATVPFLCVNLLLLFCAAGVSYPIFIEGFAGLKGRPSPDSIPAIAVSGAVLQLLVCFAQTGNFIALNVPLFSAIAGLVLFADALGNFIMSVVMERNFETASAPVSHELAYCLEDLEVERILAQDSGIETPRVLVSRPVAQMQGFLEKSFAPRASDVRAQWVAYGLLGGAVLVALISAIKGQGVLGACSSFAAVLCVGAPFSITLIAALPSLCMQRAASQVGAMVPGWNEVETLGNVNLLVVEAKELFPPLCAQLYDMKTFQKERVDLAILYATSLLAQGCDTLKDHFLSVIEHKEELLYPVKDFETRHGQGFVGWCEHYHVILGARSLLQSEGIVLPSLEEEEKYTEKGTRQILYLAVSGQLYAMFIIGYRGEKKVAYGLQNLRKAGVRLLVRASDPTLSARSIEQIYHLPRGFVCICSEEQSVALATATAYREKADGALLHLGGFTSVAGGLKAASGAQVAERSAAAVQLFAMVFFLCLSVFLCVTGGLLQVALIAALIYQAAWSTLTLGVILTKKFL